MIVVSLTAAVMPSRSARNPGLSAMRTALTPNMWAALSKDGWAVRGSTISGARACGRCMRAQSRAVLTAIMLLSVPPAVTLPRPLRGVQKVEQHGDHLGLVATQARIGTAAVERIVGDVHLVRGVRDADDVLASEIGRLEDAGVTPGKIPSPGGLHLAPDLVPGSSTLREPSIGHDECLPAVAEQV